MTTSRSATQTRQAGTLSLDANGVSMLIAYGVSMVITLYFCAVYPDERHWFVIPVILCGGLIGADAVDWVRGRVGVLDPIGIVGLVGIHFFLLAPLLHVSTGYWMYYVTPPPDWRPWLGGMAVINFAGLVLYRISRRLIRRDPRSRFMATKWLLNPSRFIVFLPAMLVLAGLLQVWVYSKSGGLLGYMIAAGEKGGFQGMGWVFMFSESFPIFAMMGFAAVARNKERLQSWGYIFAALTVFLLLAMLFGGLRGSRANTVWSLFWAVGIIHFWVRRVPRTVFYAGGVFLVVFMYFYGFYKSTNVDALQAFEGGGARAALENSTGRTMNVVILGDLARSDVQAFLLYRLLREDSDYRLAWGQTYIGDVALMVPAGLWPNRPPSKVKAGTDALYGQGQYDPDRWWASNQYGLAGEAMLNFGALAVPFSYVLLGLFVGLVRRYSDRFCPNDTRLLLLPVLITLCFWILISDLDNVIWVAVKDAVPPMLLIFLTSRRYRAVPGQGRTAI